jgi:hypothetical protein
MTDRDAAVREALERLIAEYDDPSAHGRPSRYAWDQARAALAISEQEDPRDAEITLLHARIRGLRDLLRRNGIDLHPDAVQTLTAPPEPVAPPQQADPDRRLKEMLFEFIRRIENGEMRQEDHAYGGVLTRHGTYAWLCLTFQPQDWRPGSWAPQQAGVTEAMVERGLLAYCGSRRINVLTSRRIAMRAALTAALSAQGDE